MSRLLILFETLKTAILEAGPAWSRAEYRKSVALAGGLLLGTVLICDVPLGSGRPLIDVSAGATTIVSTMLDAIGTVHHVAEGGLSITQPGLAVDSESLLGIGWPAAITILATLIWVSVSNASPRHTFALSAGAVWIVLVANVLTLFVAALLGSALAIELSSGIGAVMAIALRFSLALGLQFCLIRAVETAVAGWKFRQSLRDVHGYGNMPMPVKQERRREVAIIAGCFVCVLGLWMAGRTLTDEALITTYRQVAKQSLNAHDLLPATVAVERLMQLDAVTPAHRFLQAQLLEARGDVGEAETIVRTIVSVGGREFAPAHRWLANHIAKRRSHLTRPQSKDDEQAVSHLSQATVLDPTNIDAHIALAESYLARRSPGQAIRELEQVVDDRPGLRLTLARLCVISGQADVARLHGELAREFYDAELAAYPLSPEPRLRLAASLMFLEDFPQATAVLLKGQEQSQNDIYRQALGTTYLFWHDTVTRQGAEKGERLTLLKKSLGYAPDHPETLERIALLATAERRSGPAIDLLTRALADGPIPASVHLILGTNAHRHGRVENALRHLEEAYRLDPESVEALNNFAVVLSETDPPQLERARKLADEAVRGNPNLASIRETRGQILAKLELWSLAVADLENAMQVMRNNPKIHATLADAYTQLGDSNLAAEHRRLADKHRSIR